jgi:hypothetical protein
MEVFYNIILILGVFIFGFGSGVAWFAIQELKERNREM